MNRQRRVTSLLVLAFGIMTFGITAMLAGVADAQGPGSEPPRSIIQSSSDTVEPNSGSPLRVKGFLFLDESGVPVLMPGTTFEEIERLQNLEAGVDSRSQAFDFQSLEITGAASQGRAELKIVIRLTIDSTSGRTVAIPLRMRNFIPLGPPDVSGLDEYRMTVSGSESGHVLMLKTNRRRDVVITMNVAARVEPGPNHSLQFQLPDVPSLVRITTDDEQFTGEIVGRGDEVLQTQRSAANFAEFVIESGGGLFTLRWGKRDRATDGAPLLEIDNSRIVVQWDTPQDQPIASCQMIIRSVRGSINALKLRLPENAVLLDTPTLGSNGQSVEIISPVSPTGPSTNGEGTVLDIVIPEGERQQRIDLNLDIQFSASDPNAANPLIFRAPEVIGALRQRGEIQVSTGDDFRLRWRSRPWVQSILAQPTEETGRSYLFRYDRASFDLPIWLATTRRQLRLSTEAEISLHDSIARVKYRILSSGRAAEGTMLKVDMGSWRLRSIENEETSEQIETGLNGNLHEIYMESVANGDPSPIRIVAEHDLPSGLQPDGNADANEGVAFTLPRITDIEDTMLVQSSTVSVANQGRMSFVVDLQDSQNIDRVINAENATAVETPRSNYRIIPPDAPGKLAGHVVQQSPTISLAGDATIEIEGQSLHTTLDWIVNSSLDLEGRLPIQIASPDSRRSTTSTETGGASLATTEDAGSDPSKSGDTGEAATANVAPLVSPIGWTVKVNNQPAVLESRGDDRYELISDQLASGSMAIRWELLRPLRQSTNNDQIETVAIPRPFGVDTTFRGSMRVMMQGDAATEIVAADSTTNQSDRGEEASNSENNRTRPSTARGDDKSTMILEALPREPLRLRVRSRQTDTEDVFISRAVLRTTAGYATRMEQLLADVEGSPELRLGLPTGDYMVSAEALVDGNVANVRRESNALVIQLPADGTSHLVDLRVWLPLDASTMAESIGPALDLPIGVGRVYWEIVTPQDSHVIWASPTLGRSMAWRFDRWRLYRESTQTSRSMAAWVGGTDLIEVPRGNRYLYVGSDVRSFRAVVVSRTVLWAATGSIVLFIAVLLSFVPQTRHPLFAVVAAVMFAGLLVVAPDAAVLAGQLGMIALVLVVVMSAIRTMVQSRDHSSALDSRPRSRRIDGSTQMQKDSSGASRGTISATRSMAHASSVNKVTP
ncbi:hypothetical protein SH528x_003889 [Novipirellula sp. SH528]|uniref:hypothetical protein n=1 Tax=Novipirellula sp. SH528 TaxID=3454466 RepID=UPI003FA0AE90